MRHWLVRGLVVATAVGAAVSTPLARQSAPLSVRDAVASYSRGEFSAAVHDLGIHGLKVGTFTRALDEWIAAGDSGGRQHRALVAAAFALDVNWTATRTILNSWLNPGDSDTRIPPIDPARELMSESSSQGLVAQWAVQQLAATGVPEPLERMLWLAAIGLTEDAHGWHRLQHEIVPLARQRLSNEPRVRLAGVLAGTNLDLRLLRRVFTGRDILRKESLGSAVTGHIPAAIRALEPLLADASLSGEVELRTGYLELRRNNWSAALVRFDGARSKALDPTLRAAADYFAGWVFEQLHRNDDAIVAYRRALVITPTMRNLATRLSALLYLRNERVEAYSVLDIALNAHPAPLDLMVEMERADARFLPEWLASIRNALK